MRRRGLSWFALLPLLPVLAVQGRRVSRSVVRLPEADGAHGEVPGSEPARHVVLVGDSVAAGVGIANHSETMAGSIARRLGERDARRVCWDIVAQSGADAREAARLVREPAALAVLGRADLVVVSIGVNDTKGLVRDATWVRGLADLLDGVLGSVPDASRVVLLGVPPMDAFPSLPRALARILGARARRLDAIGADLVERRPRVERLGLDRSTLVADANPFAADGFHPSVSVHRRVAERIVPA